MARHTAPGAGAWVPERLTLASMRKAVEQCRGCELYEDATHGVMGRGAADAALMLLGEQPGDHEDKQGEPFVGPAGKLLDRALAQAGVDTGNVYVSNVVKHFRWREGRRPSQRLHRSPTTTHIAACGPWLLAELEMVTPRGVVLLGASAGKAVYGPGFKVGDARGKPRDWPGTIGGVEVGHAPQWALATVHPSAVLRSRQREEDFEGLVADLRAAHDLLGG
jgi:uracil-DNA glycosylase family protein